MNAAEIRSLFLDYYTQHGHTAVPSASLVPSSYDPSVLLTTAGMQPFKPYFMGEQQPPAPRLTSCQKCFRTPDIDQVGSTARHLTFFEMLGNFSFGDYFKEGAVQMAWDLLTGPLGLPQDKLWATVHEGDPALGLGLDQEAFDLWADRLPKERIVALGEDNFWKAGPTGPCGPCSEIYYDRGAEYGCGADTCAPGCDCDRYLEFYNLVFMQYNRDAAGVLTPLPNQNIDTGMGLERIASLIQGNVSVFEIDSFRTVMAWAEDAAGVTYGADPAATKALRVLADHGRAMTFLASDGVLPSNEGRGYVLRRVIRRAIQQAERIGLVDSAAGTGGGVLEALSGRVVDVFGDHYPQLREQREPVAALLRAEEQRFLSTLATGSLLLRDVVAAAAAEGSSVLPGDQAFKLHDTFGFPVELTAELAAESGMSVDRGEFDRLMQQQRERARAAAGGGTVPADVAAAFARSAPATEFVGYDALAGSATVSAVQAIDSTDGEAILLVKLDRSPLYPAGGGQVSDAGSLTGPNGRADVVDVLRFETDQALVVRAVDGTIEQGDEVTVEVPESIRRATEANHTATHLLHKALRDTLGDHVRQAGSLVAPDRLRFDFTHPTAVTRQQLEAIERTVNDWIARAEPVSWREMPIDEARDAGAMMLFGEKYGDVVRMVSVGDGYSRELCGGTHVANTAAIRLFVITSESSVGSNARRIEALTGDGALTWLRTRAMAAEQAARALNTEIDALPERAEQLVRTSRQLEKELASARSGAGVDAAVESATQVGGVNVVVHRADGLGADELLELADRLKNKLEPAAVLLGAASPDGKVALLASVSDAAVERGIKAGDVIGTVARAVGGGGGGRPTMARAGGKDAAKLDEALELGRQTILDSMQVPAS